MEVEYDRVRYYLNGLINVKDQDIRKFTRQMGL